MAISILTFFPSLLFCFCRISFIQLFAYLIHHLLIQLIPEQRDRGDHDADRRRQVYNRVDACLYCLCLYPEETAKDMLMQAPSETLRQMFGGLHVMSYEQAILELKELYESKSNI